MRFLNVVRPCSLGVVALILALGTSACGGGGGVDKGALKNKIKSEQGVKNEPDSVVDCMADAALKYADKDSLQSYIDGKIKADDVKGLNNKEANKAIEACEEQDG